jgi:hypothetical protein
MSALYPCDEPGRPESTSRFSGTPNARMRSAEYDRAQEGLLPAAVAPWRFGIG